MARRASPPMPMATSARAPQRAGRSDFAELIAAAPVAARALPYTHVTDGYAFRDILTSGKLTPTHCRVFGTDLLYLFYGRPAYRAAAEIESNGIDAYWPVCIVLDPINIVPARVFPFDSGAFHHGRFDGFMYHRMIKEDFEVTADPASPQRIVRTFWASDQSYYDAEFLSGLSGFQGDTMDFEAKSYVQLISSTGRAPFDERNSSVEVQVAQPVDLAGNTIAVILPSAFAKPPVLERIEEWGALALPFGVVRRHDAQNMVGQIYDTVRDLLTGKHGRTPWW